MDKPSKYLSSEDYCRIGSLETLNIRISWKLKRLLPHRQLRNN